MRKLDLQVTVVIVTVGFIIAITVATGWWFFGRNVDLVTGGSFEPAIKTEIRGNTVSLALGDVLWIKAPGGDRGAIRFNRMTNDWGADYTSWYLPPESHDSLQTVSPSRGHVFERYWRKRTKVHSFEVHDIGGDCTVECGPLTIEWSASTWLYIPAGYQFAISTSPSAGVEVDTSLLDWHRSTGQ